MGLLNQAQFAKQQGWKRSYVTQLKQAGRLVVTPEGLVDVDASLALIAKTADPNRDDVVARHAKARIAATPVQTSAQGGPAVGAEAPANASSAPLADQISASYSKSRAVKEHYAAQTAKLTFEREAGKVCDTAEVIRAATELGILLRSTLEGLPDRLAPELIAITDVAQMHARLSEECANILREFSSAAEAIAKTITKGAA